MNPREQLAAADALIDEFKDRLAALNDEPNTAVLAQNAQGPSDHPDNTQVTSFAKRGILTLDERIELQTALRKLDSRTLYAAFVKQANKQGMGIPYDVWVAAGGPAVATAMQTADPEFLRMLDSSNGAALIRQDLEPIMYELFVRAFPAFDRFDKEPSNGLVHTYTQMTGYGEAEFMSELGTVTDDRGEYLRQTTNIAVIGTRRGVSLKNQFAALQSGSGFNPERSELRAGLIAVRAKMQRTIFQGNAENTESGGTADDEAGAFDPDGFTGLRQLLNTDRAKNVDPTLSTPENMRAAIERANIEIMDAGGSASVIYTSATNKGTFDLQQEDNVRYVNELVDVAVGFRTNAVNGVFGPLPLVSVPGPSIGTYDTDDDGGSFSGGETVSDLYILDEETISLPYLGSEGPSVIEIPMGVTGQLTRLFIIFGMWGLALKAPTFSNKVRVEQAA